MCYLSGNLLTTSNHIPKGGKRVRKKIARRALSGRSPRRFHTNWTIQLIASGPSSQGIGPINLRYGPDETAIGQTGLCAKAEPHSWVPRVLIAMPALPKSGFNQPLPQTVQVWEQPGGDSKEVGVGFYLYPDGVFAVGDLVFRLDCEEE